MGAGALLLVSDRDELFAAAAAVRARAHAPYSNFRVGAALRGADGSIHVGCNVENASYGLTICAERAAVFRAIADGCSAFAALALSVGVDAMPCGACRQVLHEFAPALPIWICDGRGRLLRETTLDKLLPEPFSSIE